ncbi:MAG: hypothetical protein WBB36_12300 [Chitinophagales bacterium]
MKSNRTIVVIAVAAICLLLAFVLYQFRGNNQVNWYAMFREKENQPYDVSVISKLLADYFPGKQFTSINKPLVESLPLSSAEKSSYVFIGAELYFSDTDRVQLRDFVYNGNDAFIVTEVLPEDLLTNIFKSFSYNGYIFHFLMDSTIHVNLVLPSLIKSGGYTYDYIYAWKKEIFEWRYFSDSIKNGGPYFISLGTMNDSLMNFIKVPYGKGAFYLHSNPICFTNYYLKEHEGLEYAQKIFSHLSSSDIYWDEFSKVPQMNPGNRGDTETPLRYILSQTSLRWSWYVLLVTSIMFLLFRAKRNQRIIPVVEQNTNSSLEFIHTMGRLYLLQHDHRALALQKMKLFLTFIRSRYGLQTKTTDHDFVLKLSEKSQVEHNRIVQLLEEYQTIENMNDISEAQLTSFHLELESFYGNCK